MSQPELESEARAIIVHSKRQMMDWSLVLASQDVPTRIEELNDSTWALVVRTEDYTRALDAIRQYRAENRNWSWRQPIPWSEAAFHWGALGWCFLLILVHWFTFGQLSGFRETGQFDSLAVLQGQWWRAFTAILLHWDLGHLLANCTIGLLLLGLAMARYGASLGLLASYLAGAVGNLAGFLLYSKPYHGMGASGMILGALGLIALPPLLHRETRPSSWRELLVPAAASLMLFVLLGVDPTSDLIAHLGGFVAGTLLGVGLSALPAKLLHSKVCSTLAWLTFAGLLVGTSVLALRSPSGPEPVGTAHRAPGKVGP